MLGIDLDDLTIAALVAEGRHREDTPTAALYRRFLKERMARIRHAPAPANRRFRAWRAANIARCDLQLSRADNAAIPHSPFAIELTEGCSVGCWFCGAGAARLAGHARYDSTAALWREMLDVLAGACGSSSAARGFLYWATDPLDNPDYERYCNDYAARLGRWPAMTTALALKNVERTRRLLVEAERNGQRHNRFSVLTLRMLERIEQAFSPDELLFVDLVLQNPEADTLKSLEGRFQTAAERDPTLAVKELAKLRSWVLNPEDVELPTTTACVTGFIVNLLHQRVQLVSPCRSTEAWPLGHYVFAEAHFDSGADFLRIVSSMIDNVMTPDVPSDRAIRLSDGVQCTATTEGLRLIARTEEVDVDGDRVRPFLHALAELLPGGTATVHETIEWGTRAFGMDEQEVRDVLSALWKAGALDMAPHVRAMRAMDPVGRP